ncbi:hypothetical protein ACKWTF_002691 [Chironomus riparius]
MLANIEDRMYFDQSGSLDSLSFEEQKKKIRAKLERKKLEKPKIIPDVVISSPEDIQNEEFDDEDEKVDAPKPVSAIVLNVDPFIYEIYEDVLYNILHQLNHDASSNKLGDDYEDENDQPPIESDSAFSYVRDAFGISIAKHDESLDRVKAKTAPETNVNQEENESKANKQSFCLLSPKIKNFEYIEAHCALLQILLKHELETSKIPPFFWSGKFNYFATKVLSIHTEFRFIDEPYTSFARWAAYSEIHRHHPLSLQIFNKLLDNIIDVYKDEFESAALAVPKMSFIPACFGFIGNITTGVPEIEAQNRCSDQLKTKDDEVVKLFWNSAYKLQDAFLDFIHNLHYKADEEESFIKIVVLRNIFEIVKRIDKVFLPRDVDERRFVDLMTKSLTDGTIEHFMRNVNQKILKQTKNNEKRLEELIRVIKFVQEHFKQFVEEFGHVFLSFYDIKFAELLYKVYDSQLAFIIKPIVLEISKTKEGNIDNFANEEEEAVAVQLFKLYRELKKYSDYGMEAYGNYEFETKDYSNWFSAGIDKWCKVSVFSAMSRIEKSIDVDNLKPESKDAKYSSSAIDTIQILYSVKGFWENLQWPDTVKEAEIANHIAGDLCRFATMYFDKFGAKVLNTEAMNNTGIFKVPLELAVAIANFNYISDKMQILIDELTKDKESDRSSIQKFLGNALKYLMDTTYKLLNNTIKKSVPTIKKLMLEGGEEYSAMDDDIADRLMTYIEDMLLTLHDDLPNREFEVAKSILWQDMLAILAELIQSSIGERMSPEFFTNLRRIFTILKQIFKYSEELSNDDVLNKKIERIDYLLECYGLNTSRLIHQYYKDRYDMQQQINKTPFNPYGILTVFCHFTDNILRIEILNARNLIPIGPNRKCDSFVKVHIIPDKYFPTCQNFKTKVQQNTHFPLYDEVFEFTLTREQRIMKDAIIYFNIKDKYLIGSNECLAEAFLSFSDIPEFVHKDKMKQIHLTLTRLQSDELESLKAIQHRSQLGDKDAKDFLAKLRSRTLLSPKKLKIPVTQL